MKKAGLLAWSARFDLCGACTGAGEGRQRSPADQWIYPAALPDGKTTRILKVLQTNVCTKDCLYCENRASRDIPRMKFSPDELARLFMRYHEAGMVNGLFLSSSFSGKADPGMARMIATTEILRFRFRFNGYIHLKVLPGASRAAVERAAQLADRMSINLEAPGPDPLKKIARAKDFQRDLLPHTEWIQQAVEDPGTRARSQTTQFVVGPAGESDRDILTCVDHLYRERRLARTYYSAYQVPDKDAPLSASPTPLLREHRLYQADFLLRRYGFDVSELVFEHGGNLSFEQDPKQRWAGMNPEFFPVEIHDATKEFLLRVPGIGPVTAKRICSWRRKGSFQGPEDLRKAGVILGRAAPYILINGRRVSVDCPQPHLPFPELPPMLSKPPAAG